MKPAEFPTTEEMAQNKSDYFEKKYNELVEAQGMKLAAISTACIQNTESTIKDRIEKTHDYWTVAYADVCMSIDREMAWREYALALKSALENASKELGVPQPGYPQPVANACDYISNALLLKSTHDKILNR